MNLGAARPIVGEGAFIAPSASLIGDVEVGAGSGVWYGAVVRGDSARVTIGDGAQVLERAVINTVSGPVTAGALSRIDAGAYVSGSELSAEAAVGAGCVVNSSSLGAHAVLAPGSTLDGADVPSGELWAGAPAVFVRKLSAEEVETLVAAARDAQVLAQAHAHENGKSHDQIEAERLREELLRDRSDDYHSHLGIVGREKEIIETQARIVEAERRAQAAAGRS